MAEATGRDRSSSVGGERVELNVRWPYLLATIIAGGLSSQAIAHWVPSQGKWLAILFLGYSVYGLVYAVKGILTGYHLQQRAKSGDVTLVGRVYATANLRRELLRGVGHANIFLLGLLSLLPVPPDWFHEFFIASMFNLVYVMDVNATLDDTLDERLRKAEGVQIRLDAEKAYQEKMAREFKTVRNRKKKGAK